MPKMRRVEFPKIILTLVKTNDEGEAVLDDKDCPQRPHSPRLGALPDGCFCRPVRERIKAQRLYSMALAQAGTNGYEALRLHLPISAAIDEANGSSVLLDEKQWMTLVSALEAYKQWPWYHDDVLRVIDAAKEAEEVEVKENRAARRRKMRG